MFVVIAMQGLTPSISYGCSWLLGGLSFLSSSSDDDSVSCKKPKDHCKNYKIYNKEDILKRKK